MDLMCCQWHLLSVTLPFEIGHCMLLHVKPKQNVLSFWIGVVTEEIEDTQKASPLLPQSKARIVSV